MKKAKYICNRCKREIMTTAPIQIYGEYISRDGSEYREGKCLELEDYHFCAACADKLFNLMEKACEKGVPAVPNPDFEEAVEEMIATSHKHGGGPKEPKPMDPERKEVPK